MGNSADLKPCSGRGRRGYAVAAAGMRMPATALGRRGFAGSYESVLLRPAVACDRDEVVPGHR